MSLAGSKYTVSTDRPWIEVERRLRTPGAPLSAASSGRVTSVSTCVGVSPGASAWMPTWGGANSGNTS